MPYPPFPSMYNPFLVSEPQIAVPPQLAAQQTVYPQMTSTNQMQMFDEALIKNNLDRINPDKSIYLDPISNPLILPREYNQPNALQEKFANIPNIVKNIEYVNNLSLDDMGGAGVLAKTSPEPTTYLDQIMGNVESPYVPDYIPFTSPEEMFKAEMNVTPEPEITLDQIPTINDKKLMLLKKQQDADALQLQAKSLMGDVFSGNNNKYPADRVKDWMSSLFKNEPTEQYTTKPQQNKFGLPEAYYLGKGILDTTALINNMVQPQPPSVQMKLPYFERQRLNPEPYDAMRSQIGEQANAAYRLQRENISQASDLMKGLSAVTSGTQQAMMNVGLNQAAALQQVQDKNQAIAMQEQGAQTEILNQETMANYQIQQQAQQFKDQMVSTQLGKLTDTAGAYTDYVAKKEYASKLTEMTKDQAEKGNAIQVAMLKYQAGQNELQSDAYKEAQKQNINQYISETKKNLYGDPKYSKLKETYGDNYDPLTLDQRESRMRTLEQRLNILGESHDGFVSPPEEPKRPANMKDEEWAPIEADYKKRKDRFDSDKEAYDKYKLQLDRDKPVIELERQFVNDLKSSYDIAGKRQEFQSKWFKDRGLKSMSEVIQEVEALVNPNRQIFY